MYCSRCGQSIDPGSRFCSACGAPTQTGSAATARLLLRRRQVRLIAGICAGFAEAYGWDLNLVRVITVVLLFLSAGTVALAYFALWIILPEAPYELPDSTSNGTFA